MNTHPRRGGLLAVLLVALMLQPVHAQTPDAPAAPATPAPAPAAAGEAKPTEVVLPDLNPADYFEGRQGGTFGGPTAEIFTRNNKVIVSGFRVIFVNYSEASARVRGSYLPGRDSGEARSKTIVNLVGVDDATLQKITDAAFEKFVAQLKAAGREVLTHKDIPDLHAGYKGVAPGTVVEFQNSKGKAFAPTGMPVWFAPFDFWTISRFDQTNSVADATASQKHGAITLSPQIVVDFAQMQSTGNQSGLMARSASTGAELSMGVRMLSGMATRAEEVRGYGVHKGDSGAITLKKRIDTDIAFAALQKVEEKKGGIMSFLGAVGSNTSKSTLDATTSNEDYSKAASVLLTNVTGSLARWLAANPAARK